MSNQIARINMVKQQLRTGDVLDERILTLFEEIPREDFVPQTLKDFAYSDMQLPLDHHQKMMTPLEEGLILQALALQGNETVLLVGTGTGFLTALLSRLCKKVISVDYFADFTEKAKAKLAAHFCNNVELITGDASSGWVDKAPYDALVFTAAIPQLTETHRLQLIPGGKLFAVVGEGAVMHGQIHRLDHRCEWQSELLFETHCTPIIDNIKRSTFQF